MRSSSHAQHTFARRVAHVATSGRPGRALAVAGASAALLAGMTSTASATNPYTLNGNNTQACAVAWHAQSDVSGAYPDYSNAGYIYEIAPGDAYPAVKGPGHFLVQHWFSGQTINYRLPVATDHAMYDVTVKVSAGTTNWTLNTAAGVATPSTPTMTNLDLYRRFDGNARFTVQAPAPTVTVKDGGFELHWDVLPAGSAGIYSFTGTTAMANPGAPDAAGQYAHFLVDANLTAKYAEGAGCAVTQPAAPTVPAADVCQTVLAGRTLFPLGAPDVTARIKTGADGETNADGWGSGDSRYVRLYGGTDRELTNVTFTATAAQGLTFASPGAVVTGSPRGMGALYGNGFTAAATGVGTPQLSADGTTVTLTIAHMPAHSAFAFTAKATPDGTLKQMVMDERMQGAQVDCTPPTSSGQGGTTPTPDPATSTPVQPAGDPVAAKTPDATPAGSPAETPVVTPAPAPVAVATQRPERTRLAITKSGPGVVRAGERVTYTIRVSNIGRVNARRVVITDTVPASMALAATPRGVSLQSGRVVVSVPRMAPGASRSVRLTFVLHRNATGARTNTATAVAENAARVGASTRATIVTVRNTATQPATPAVTG